MKLCFWRREKKRVPRPVPGRPGMWTLGPTPKKITITPDVIHAILSGSQSEEAKRAYYEIILNAKERHGYQQWLKQHGLPSAI